MQSLLFLNQKHRKCVEFEEAVWPSGLGHWISTRSPRGFQIPLWPLAGAVSQ